MNATTARTADATGCYIPSIETIDYHAGTFWYILVRDVNTTNPQLRYIRLYKYAPGRAEPVVEINPARIESALKMAKRHNLHPCTIGQECVVYVQAKAEAARATKSEQPSAAALRAMEATGMTYEELQAEAELHNNGGEYPECSYCGLRGTACECD